VYKVAATYSGRDFGQNNVTSQIAYLEAYCWKKASENKTLEYLFFSFVWDRYLVRKIHDI